MEKKKEKLTFSVGSQCVIDAEMTQMIDTEKIREDEGPVMGAISE